MFIGLALLSACGGGDDDTPTDSNSLPSGNNTAITCPSHSTKSGSTCYADAGFFLDTSSNTVTACTNTTSHASAVSYSTTDSGLTSNTCTITLATCSGGYSENASNHTCVSTTQSCSSSELLAARAASGTKTWASTSYGSCAISTCEPGYTLSSGSCSINSVFSVNQLTSGASDGAVYRVTPFGNKIFYFYDDGNTSSLGMEPWVFDTASSTNKTGDGTNPPLCSKGYNPCMLVDLNTGASSSYTTAGEQASDKNKSLPVVTDSGTTYVYFGAEKSDGTKLMRTDGTTSGTSVVQSLGDITSGNSGQIPHAFANLSSDGYIAFVVSGSATNAGIWRHTISSGTSSLAQVDGGGGTTPDPDIRDMVRVGTTNSVAFRYKDHHNSKYYLGTYDLSANTVIISGTASAPGNSGFSTLTSITNVDSLATGPMGDYGVNYNVFKQNSYVDLSLNSSLIVNNKLYFQVHTGTVCDINNGSSCGAGATVNWNRQIYELSNNTVTRYADSRLSSLYGASGTYYAIIDSLMTLGTKLFFGGAVANGSILVGGFSVNANSTALQTPSQTFNWAGYAGNEMGVLPSGNGYVMAATPNSSSYNIPVANGGYDVELYSSNATLTSTPTRGSFPDINANSGGSSYPRQFTTLGSNLYFVAKNTSGYNQLYKIDSSDSASVHPSMTGLNDVLEDADSAQKNPMFLVNGLLYFVGKCDASDTTVRRLCRAGSL